MKLCLQDLVVELLLVLPLEGQVTWNQCVKYHSKRPKIRLRPIFALNDFRSHIVGCSCNSCKFRLRCCSETKIDQTHCIFFCDHYVVWFDVTMHDLLGVTMVNCLEKTLHVFSGLSFSKCLILLLADFVVKGHSGDIFHHQIDVFLIVVSFVILYNVGVVKSVKCSNFVHHDI